MVPVPISARNSHSSRLLYVLFSLTSNYAPRILHRPNGDLTNLSRDGTFTLARRDSQFNPHEPKSIVFVILIPVLVLMSGLFAGLTLGYMSLDETQLNVLSISGTPEQRKYANKIMPIRKNGHLLLVTLLLANMIVNESLPVIADPILGGGVESVVVSTVLIVIFSEIIPQSLFTRHGLYLGAKMAGFTKCLIYALGIISWPVAKLLEFLLGPHHGIIYRRAELKELIAMHSSHATHGGDLKTDTVTIIGATLDLQEKVVEQAMTPIKDVFMLSIDSALDYNLLKKICQTGHSRVPVYEEVNVPISVVARPDETPAEEKQKQRTQKVKKIIGILLVKQCVLLDPKDATPLRKIPLNKVPFVPNDEPLLGILDKFQEGRSHMAIVSRFSVDKAASVKKAVKLGLTQRLRKRVGMGDTDSDTESSDEEKNFSANAKKRGGRRKLMNGLTRRGSQDSEDGDTVKGDVGVALYEHQYDIESATNTDVENGRKDEPSKETGKKSNEEGRRSKITSLQLPKLPNGMTSMSMLEQREQSMPADAVLAKEGAAEFLQGFDPAVMPLGIITLEDVLEELIGEEIYDEFDTQGAHGDPYEVPPAVHVHDFGGDSGAPSTSHGTDTTRSSGHGQPKTGPSALTAPIGMPIALKGLFRTRSAPPVPREKEPERSSIDGSGQAVAGGKTVRINQDVAHENPTLIQMPKPIRSPGRHPPSVILEQHSSVSSSDSGVAASLLPLPTILPTLAADAKSKTLTVSSPVASNTSNQSPGSGSGPVSVTSPILSSTIPAPAVQPHKIEKAPSRSASPGPALEAILLDRKRRLAAAHVQTPGTHSPVPGGAGGGGSGNVTASPSPAPSSNPATTSTSPLLPATSAPPANPAAVGVAVPAHPGLGATRSAHGTVSAKGTRFKSSPLGGGERAGVVVAEKVGAAYGKDKDGQAQGEVEGLPGQGNVNLVNDDTMAKTQSEEGRIPGEIDKTGPDKA